MDEEEMDELGYFELLPNETILHIIGFLETESIFNICFSNKAFKNVYEIMEKYIWLNLLKRDYNLSSSIIPINKTDTSGKIYMTLDRFTRGGYSLPHW